ncbi:MAG: hypothetical protein J6U49_01050 [Alistipes sp.]|nr:hypothetical protein [Alistipes sp.]
MGIFTTKINGVRVSLATLREMYNRTEEEYKELHEAYALRVKERDDAKALAGKARYELKKVMDERDQLREQLAKANAEIEARLKQVSDLSGQVAVARKVANDKRTEAEELRKWQPKRGKGGRFVKKN